MINSIPKAVVEAENTELVAEEIGGQIGGQINFLTERQKEVFEIIVNNPKVTRKRIAEILQINESAVQDHTDALKNKNIIKRKGGTRGFWLILLKK